MANLTSVQPTCDCGTAAGSLVLGHGFSHQRPEGSRVARAVVHRPQPSLHRTAVGAVPGPSTAERCSLAVPTWGARPWGVRRAPSGSRCGD